MKNKILSIQALRGIAVLLVVAFHFRDELNKSFPGMGDKLFINGSIGVDLFFVISGFIVFHIADSLNSGVKPAKQFIIKRLCRMVPPYYLITLCIAGGSYASWYESIRSMLFIPLAGEFGPGYGYARLYVGWSLNYEMFFYLISAFAVLIFSDFRKWVLASGLLLGLTLLPSLYFGWNNLNSLYGYNFGNAYLKMATNPIMLEFLCGIFIGIIYKKSIFPPFKKTILVTFIISIAYFIYVLKTGFMWGHGPLAFMIPAALIVATSLEVERSYNVTPPAWLIYIGEISFSAYLIHPRAISLAHKVSDRIPALQTSDKSGIIIFVLSFILTLILSFFSYKYIERGLCVKLRNVFLTSKRKAAATV